MGASITNVSLKGASQEQVAAQLRNMGRSAFVGPTLGGYTTIFDEVCDQQDLDELERLAVGLSSALECPAMAVLVHDSDVLILKLVSRGVLLMDYNSCPGYFGEGPTEPEGSEPVVLCRELGAGNAEVVREILEHYDDLESGADPKYLFAEQRLGALAEELGLPEGVAYACFSGINELQQIHQPVHPDFEPEVLMRVP